MTKTPLKMPWPDGAHSESPSPELSPAQVAFAKLLGRLLAEMYYEAHADPAEGSTDTANDPARPR